MTLSDGTPAQEWDRPQKYSRTYWVAQGDPHASDRNPGTRRRPFLTIGRAAELLEPGQRVVVRAGIYREWVRPARGGTGPTSMICYEPQPGEEVVIRGSVELPHAWTRTGGVWTIQLPREAFAENNPFAHDNMAEGGDQYIWDLDYWAKFRGKVPFALKRGLLFQNGRRLAQVLTAAEVEGTPGAYWVGKDGWSLTVRPFDDADPNAALMEATNRRAAFAPTAAGVSFIRLRGFRIEQVGNAFSYPVNAAVSPMGGHHWIVEGNVVRQINATGINLGSVRMDDTPRTAPDGSDCIVRRNTILDCGASGINGHSIMNGIIEDNVVARCGWQDFELWYDNGGMKLLVCTNLLVRHNLVYAIDAAPGIWLDWGNRNCRVTQNVIWRVRSMFGGIFVEASHLANRVDHNVVLDIQGSVIYQHDSDELLVDHNLVARCSDSGVRMNRNAGRIVEGRVTTCERNRVLDNVLLDVHTLVHFADPGNTSDRNLVWNSAQPGQLAAWRQSSGQDAASVERRVVAYFDSETLRLRWFAAVPDTGAAPEAGPFEATIQSPALLELFVRPVDVPR
jgi:hypothetical protein